MSSNDTFSFDNNAVPAVMDSSQNDSIESSGVHSSHEGSFSQVTSVARSESVKRPGPPIEDAEREEQRAERPRSASSSSRALRAPASSKQTTRSPSARRSREKTKRSGGSPQERRGGTNADDMLEERLREMQDQDKRLRSQVKMFEDENFAELAMYNHQMRSIKDEYTEFDRQYNHVLDQWKHAMENSMTFEMEMRSEARLFHEARAYTTEMQQQFGNVVQQDYGSSLRIQELEGLITRERSQNQSYISRFEQESFLEFAELRDKADRIRLEASEAIASKDSERLQERELISDEAKRINQRNGLLLSELSFAQNDAIQASQAVHEEQRMNDMLRKRATEEEVPARNLASEMNVVQSYLGIETAKTEKLQSMLEKEKEMYEQRLNLFMSNPSANPSSSRSSDIASKVEIQRLKQELSSAERALAVIPLNTSTSPNALMTREMNEMRQEIEDMKSNPSHHHLEHEAFEAKQELNKAMGEEHESHHHMKEERDMYRDEKEAYLRQEDVIRLRRERNEWKEYYDNLLAEWTYGDHGYGEEEAHETRSETSEATASFIDSGKPKISRKEADKIIVPNWPKIHELEFWKSQVTSNIVAACGDLDHDAWINWIAATFRQSPDIDGVLAHSGDPRFNSIDVKLASALMSMMQNGGDQAREVLHEARLRMAKGWRGSTPTLLKGRQLLAMVIDSFRSASNTDLVFTTKHLYDLPYPGDSDLVMFISQWTEVLECMRPGDVPNDVALRDILYDKVKGSKLMAFDLQYYEGKEDSHYEKTYQYLQNMSSKHIRLKREEKNREAKDQSLKNIRNRYKALPATNDIRWKSKRLRPK